MGASALIPSSSGSECNDGMKRLSPHGANAIGSYNGNVDDGGGDDDSANSSCHKSLATPTNGFPETGAQVARTKDYHQAECDSSPSCAC